MYMEDMNCTVACHQIEEDGNTETANVDQKGNLQVVIPLKDDANLIEVVASDQQGNERSSTVTVIYVHKELGEYDNH